MFIFGKETNDRDMDNYRAKMKRMVEFDDSVRARKNDTKQITRTPKEWEDAIDDRIKSVKRTQDVLNGKCDYDDSFTEC